MSILSSRHPRYHASKSKWQRWWSAYEGGEVFLNANLVQYNKREKNFDARKRMTPIPVFAKTAINEVVDALVARMPNITRNVPSTTYMKGVQGYNGGVDGYGTSLALFLKQEVIPRLLVQECVGIFTDAPENYGKTKAETKGARPYLTVYNACEILNFAYIRGTRKLAALLLECSDYGTDEDLLPMNIEKSYLYMRKTDDGIIWRRYNTSGTETSHGLLDLEDIPFVLMSIDKSLMEDIYRHQVALLNIASTDISFIVDANFPVYTEQMDINTMMRIQNSAAYSRQQASTDEQNGVTPTDSTYDSKREGIGNTTGRAYQMGAERPGFINPSAEPLLASMQKQEALKKEIRQITSLSLTSLRSSSTGADSQDREEACMEAGLVSLGLTLEACEREVAKHWCEFEGINGNDIVITYPRDYSLKTTGERLADAEAELALANKLPSINLKREAAKRAVRALFGDKLSQDAMSLIMKDIDAAKFIILDITNLAAIIESRVVSRGTIAEMLGLPDGEVEKAAQEHEDTLRRIARAQSEEAITNADPNGTNAKDLTTSDDRKDEKTNSQSADIDADGHKNVRGEGS